MCLLHQRVRDLVPYTRRLKLLPAYMKYFVNRRAKDKPALPFEGWMISMCTHEIPGASKQRAKYLARNCFYCLRGFKNTKRPTMDHYYPVHMRIRAQNNLYVMVCTWCNFVKDGYHPHEFARRLELAIMSGKGISPRHNLNRTRTMRNQLQMLIEYEDRVGPIDAQTYVYANMNTSQKYFIEPSLYSKTLINR